MRLISTRLVLLIAGAILVVAAQPTLADSTIRRTLSVNAGGTIEIDTDVGSVEVIGSDRTDVQLEISSKADDLEEKFEIEIVASNGDLRIGLDRKGKNFSWMRWDGRNNLRITLEVPRNVDLSVDTSGSRIQVDNIRGDVNLDTSGGRIEASNIRGDLIADTSGSDIIVSDVDGDVRADTSGGSIEAEKVTGNIRADTSGGGITISKIGGSVEADTSGGSIRIEEVAGSVNADTSGGGIHVTFSKAPFEGANLSTSGGSVKVYLPQGVNLDVDAAASGGSVVSDVPIQVRGKISSSHMIGKIGSGGNLLKLRSSGGTVHILAK